MFPERRVHPLCQQFPRTHRVVVLQQVDEDQSLPGRRVARIVLQTLPVCGECPVLPDALRKAPDLLPDVIPAVAVDRDGHREGLSVHRLGTRGVTGCGERVAGIDEFGDILPPGRRPFLTTRPGVARAKGTEPVGYPVGASLRGKSHQPLDGIEDTGVTGGVLQREPARFLVHQHLQVRLALQFPPHLQQQLGEGDIVAPVGRRPRLCYPIPEQFPEL